MAAKTLRKVVRIGHRVSILACVEQHQPPLMLDHIDVDRAWRCPLSRGHQPPHEWRTGRIRVLRPDPHSPGAHYGHSLYWAYSTIHNSYDTTSMSYHMNHVEVRA